MNEKTISVWWLRGLAAFLCISPIGLILFLRSNLESWLGSAAPVILVDGLIVLVAALGLLVALLILQRPWLKWDEPTGTWVHRFNGIRYCEKCKATRNVVSPLKNETAGWRCMCCERSYADPARKAKEQPATTRKHERI